MFVKPIDATGCGRAPAAFHGETVAAGREIPLDPAARVPYLVGAFGLFKQTGGKGEVMRAWGRNIVAGMGLLVVTSLLTGCAVLFVGAAAGSVAGALYYKGELTADVDATPQAVIAATEKAFSDLIWAKETASASATDGQATAHTATGKEVKVTVVTKTPEVSTLAIRIGTFGDENLSRLLYDRIIKFL